MKKKIALIIILYSLFFTMKVGITQDDIPPYNKILFKLYPDIQVKYPQAPRITAQEALLMYKSGNAFFLGCGHQNSAVLGGLYFEDYRKINIERIKAAFLPNNRLLIVY
jgi:hypothetical protein